MCRLLGYATSGFNLSLNDVLGMHEVTDFRDLSEIHNDGWGVALLSNPTELPFAAGEDASPRPARNCTRAHWPPAMTRFSVTLRTTPHAVACGTCVSPAPTCR